MFEDAAVNSSRASNVRNSATHQRERKNVGLKIGTIVREVRKASSRLLG